MGDIEEEEEITYPIRISKRIWKMFKDTVPRTGSLNEAVVELIEEKLKSGK